MSAIPVTSAYLRSLPRFACRHEYLGMQSKYDALELRSKDLIVQQSSAVGGAAMALAGLGARLDQLVEQLISSYSISEQELEVRTPSCWRNML